MKDLSLDIIIPNWNGRELLEKNLPAVFTAFENVRTEKKRLTVIDDGSDDDSVKYLAEHYPSIMVITNGTNQGFHNAVNRAVSESTADVIILLNNDMQPETFALDVLYVPFVWASDLFAVTGRIYADDKKTFLYGNRGGIFKCGHFHLKEKPEFSLSQTLFACGGGAAFDREKFIELGSFDTLFSPFYYEEQDISYRALKRGYKILYEAKSVMHHQVRATIGKTMSEKNLGYISARNNYLFVLKNITDPDYTLAFLFFTPLFILSTLLKGNPRFLIAFVMAMPRIPRALLSRLKEQRYYVKKDREIFKAVNQD
ncbi:MAG: glycosyltransferase [Candidatus Omnitrophica bacterium]|nr:glycosyltransferase [Candidatus Omnitrophota bacterium]